MYSPNLFTNDLYKLWSHTNDHDSIRAFNEFRNGGPTGRNESNHSNGQTQSNNKSNQQVLEDQRKYLRSLFAPPLSAYSADYPGASVSQLEYTIKKSVTLGGIEPYGIASALDNTTSPLTQMKIDQLEQITNTGYSTVRPIGINRTLEELDFEDARRFNTSEQVEDHSEIHTVENSNTEGQGAGVNGSNVSREVAQTEQEIDLDAQIANMDEQEENGRPEDDDGFEDEDESFSEDDGEEGDLRISNHESYFSQDYRNDFSRHEQTPAPSRGDLVAEGFMADEVEYQDDHSLGAEHNTHMLINTINTGSSIISNMNSGRSIATNLTSVPVTRSEGLGISNERDCEVHDENSIDDQSDLDMVIEE